MGKRMLGDLSYSANLLGKMISRVCMNKVNEQTGSESRRAGHITQVCACSTNKPEGVSA